MQYALWAFFLGGLSAVSLLLGSLLGVTWRPPRTVTAALTAFGGGALLAALAVELVAPTVLCLSDPAVCSIHHGDSLPATDRFAALVVGMLAGGVLFIILDQVVNARGGYLRKMATTLTFLGRMQASRQRQFIEHLQRIEFLRDLPPEDLLALVRYVRPVAFHPGEIIFRRGDPGDRMLFIEAGRVSLSDDHTDDFDVLGPGEVLGEIALLTGAPRTAHATARDEVTAFMLLREDFERLRREHGALERATRQVAGDRLLKVYRREKKLVSKQNRWMHRAARALRGGSVVPTPSEMRRIAREHPEAPLAIWLGILLDGIPESMIIGASLLNRLQNATTSPGFLDVIPFTLIAGLFLSNFPEALSSSTVMKDMGWGNRRVIFLWFSLVLTTAIGALGGYLAGSLFSGWPIVAFEGLAAGAMLTMISQTMIPEAVSLGGDRVVGLSTLCGFLGVLLFKLLEV